MTRNREPTETDTARFLTVVQAMPNRQRHVLILHRLQGWDFGRIADHLRITTQEVEVALAAAILALHKFDEAEESQERR